MRKRLALNGNTKGIVRRTESLLETAALCVLYYIALKMDYQNIFPQIFVGSGKYLLLGMYALLCWLFIQHTDGFRFIDLRRFDLVMAQVIALSIVNLLTYLQLCLIANRLLNPLFLLAFMGAQVVLVILFVCLFSASFKWLYRPYNMILIFGSENAVSMKLKMDTHLGQYAINRLISVDAGFETICQEILQYDAVIINDVPAQIRNDILKFCYERAIRTYVVPKLSDIIIRGGESISSFDTPLLLTKGFGLTITQRFLKRTMDIALALPTILLATPIMLIIAIAIKLEDHGPVFYKQKRATLGGREFNILKFRSMVVHAETDGYAIPATGRDPRITKVGRFIRVCRVDELPQLLNILKGDMSFVGPRPERLEHVQKYSQEVPQFGYRLKVKGGLTGYAQIYGKYNTSAYDKLRLDLIYIENYSLLLDLKLILMTLRILFSKESTEGFDKAEKDQQVLNEMLAKIQEEHVSASKFQNTSEDMEGAK